MLLRTWCVDKRSVQCENKKVKKHGLFCLLAASAANGRNWLPTYPQSYWRNCLNLKYDIFLKLIAILVLNLTICRDFGAKFFSYCSPSSGDNEGVRMLWIDCIFLLKETSFIPRCQWRSADVPFTVVENFFFRHKRCHTHLLCTL